jgi:hypothetical protein
MELLLIIHDLEIIDQTKNSHLHKLAPYVESVLNVTYSFILNCTQTLCRSNIVYKNKSLSLAYRACLTLQNYYI